MTVKCIILFTFFHFELVWLVYNVFYWSCSHTLLNINKWMNQSLILYILPWESSGCHKVSPTVWYSILINVYYSHQPNGIQQMERVQWWVDRLDKINYIWRSSISNMKQQLIWSQEHSLTSHATHVTHQLCTSRNGWLLQWRTLRSLTDNTIHYMPVHTSSNQCLYIETCPEQYVPGTSSLWRSPQRLPLTTSGTFLWSILDSSS